MKTYPSTPPETISRGAAFTLVELLTVIAVIGVLSAILIPALRGVQERAMLTSKTSTYRQYAIANTMYANENNGMSCPSDDTGQNSLDWRYFLKPYLADSAKNKYQANKNEIYVDPFFEEYDPEEPWDGGVGMNSRLKRPDSFYHNVLKTGSDPDGSFGRTLLSAVTYPSYRILIGDTTPGNARIYNGRLDTSRHDSKGMYVRFDGSVTLYDAEEANLGFNDPGQLKSR